MTNEPERCPACGTPRSGALEGNCPPCLMRLGTPAPAGEAPLAEPVLGLAPGQGASRRIGDYELLEEIARGGMGVVYRARQVSLKRIVAVKFLLGGQFAIGNFTKRFRREAESAASLNHPNIVSIYEVGDHDGQPYFSMELIDGRNLAEMTREKPLPPRQAAQLLKTLAEAMQFAHDRGLLHRDLKPSNVLVDAFDVPHITDFGLAKRVEGDADLTVTGQILGTPSYMPPEQADPARGPTTAASDVYSLGALLCHLLTGRAPFMADTVPATLRLVMEAEPVPPRMLNGSVPRDLDTICLKCLEKSPARRYASALELAKDLGRFLADVPIAARPTTTAEKAWRWCRRNRALAAAGAAALFLLLFVGVASPIAAFRINHDRLAADAARQDAERQRQQAELNQRKAEGEGAKARRSEQIAKERAEETRRNLYAVEMNLANQVLDLVNGVHRISSVAAKWEYERPDLRGWEWYYLNSIPHREGLILPGHHQRVNALAASPDGCRLASGSQDGTVRIWDILSSRELAILRRGSNAVLSLAWSPDGSKLAATQGRWLVIWDAAAAREFLVISGALKSASSIRTVAWSPDGRRLASGGSDPAVHLWDTSTGKPLAQLNGHSAGVTCVAWNVDSRRLASASEDGTVRVWDPATGKEQLSPLQHAAQVRCVAWNSDGTRLASGGDDNLARIWDAGTGESLSTFRAHSTVVTALAWKPGTRQLATASHHDLLLKQWDVSTNYHPLPSLRGHPSPLLSLAWSPDGSWLASAGDDGDIRIWNSPSKDAQTRNDIIQGSFESVQWSRDGQRLLLGAADGFVRIFEPSTEAVLQNFSFPTQSVSSAAWSRDGKRLAISFGADAIESLNTKRPAEARAERYLVRPIQILDASTGEPLLQLFGHTGAVHHVVWSPDSKQLLSASLDGTAKIWDSTTGHELQTLRTRGGQLLAADWSPDARRVATGSRGPPGIQIWDVVTGMQVFALEQADTRCVAWSPDGARLASAHDDGTVAIWDILNGKPLLLFHGHTAGVLRVAWNPDGLRVLSADRESMIKIWDPADGRELLTLGRFARAAWSPDGVRLVCVGKGPPASMIICDATIGYAVSRSGKALPGLNRWLEAHPDDLGYLRRRAEVLAAIGEWEKSAQDYKRMLAQARDNTIRWFETGWWLGGPWPGRMDLKLPPESQLDPIRPISREDSTNQLTWQPLSTEVAGRLDPHEFIEAPQAGPESIVYAQKRLWCPQPLELALTTTSEVALRIWINGKPIEAVAPGSTPVSLTAGWNTLLTKVPFQATNGFSVKFSPANR